MEPVLACLTAWAPRLSSPRLRLSVSQSVCLSHVHSDANTSQNVSFSLFTSGPGITPTLMLSAYFADDKNVITIQVIL